MRLASGYNRPLDLAVRGIDVPPAVPNAMDDEFNDTTFDTGKWTWMDQGSWTVAEANGRVEFTGPASDGNRIRGVYQTAPSTPWTFETKMLIPNQVSNVQASMIFLGASSSSTIVACGFYANLIHTLSFATPSSAPSGVGLVPVVWPFITPEIWFEMHYDGTDYRFAWKSDRHGAWNYNYAASSVTPTIVGLGFANGAALPSTNAFEWFRRTQ